MKAVLPNPARVRPRILSSGDSLLVEDVVEQLLDDCWTGIVWLVGGPGTGKTSAAAHLLSLFYGDDRLAVLDDASGLQAAAWSESRLVVATTDTPQEKAGTKLPLRRWDCDDLVEYLLNAHPSECKSVMQRLKILATASWTPEVAQIVLERLAADESLVDTTEALYAELLHLSSNNMAIVGHAAKFSLATLAGWREQQFAAKRWLKHHDCPTSIFNLLRHQEVQLPLATQQLVSAILSGNVEHELSRQLPRDLIDKVGESCASTESIDQLLESMLLDDEEQNSAAMVASILLRVNPNWRPKARREGVWSLTGGYFQKALWDGVDLSRAKLTDCDFTQASLVEAKCRGAKARRACFAESQLQGADLRMVHATGASFVNANLGRAQLLRASLHQADFSQASLPNASLTKAALRGANLTGADLRNADLTEAQLSGVTFGEVDLSGAILRDAYLPHADLRMANLFGVCLEGANLTHAQLEDVCIREAKFQFANLSHAYFTGSLLPEADFRVANLQSTHLAEIDWEGADLRGSDLRHASLHLGSSRSGLVGSPTALEGSMTRFYTDDREEMHFKSPEHIRKANLCDSDLRGANTSGVDFYLVDLRGAKLDPNQEKQARLTGAILEDF